jgi:hypothetical protein
MKKIMSNDNSNKGASDSATGPGTESGFRPSKFGSGGTSNLKTMESFT